jgi:hypothetical protein
MREKWPKQMPLMSHILDHPQSQELEVISGIIDANPTICEHILCRLENAALVLVFFVIAAKLRPK